MLDYQYEFMRFAQAAGVLRFGNFVLKSGRCSPYFFNAGLFNRGAQLARLGCYYAQAIAAAGLDFDLLFGPAYKGIPLAAATSIALAEYHERDVLYAFNRKEAKDHGEGGEIIGAPLQGRVLIIDDVLSAGTSTQAAVTLIRAHGATPVGLVIALDRQERGQDMRSAATQIEADLGLPVTALIRLTDLLEYLAEQPAAATDLASLHTYRDRYGTA